MHTSGSSAAIARAGAGGVEPGVESGELSDTMSRESVASVAVCPPDRRGGGFDTSRYRRSLRRGGRRYRRPGVE